MSKAITRVSDTRALHYWDNDGLLSRRISYVLGLHGEPAWDVYMLYGPETEWKNQPPNPDYVMHQQIDQIPRGHFLNGDKLAQEVRNRLLSN